MTDYTDEELSSPRSGHRLIAAGAVMVAVALALAVLDGARGLWALEILNLVTLACGLFTIVKGRQEVRSAVAFRDHLAVFLRRLDQKDKAKWS